jgi:methionyl-tRNA synthetase
MASLGSAELGYSAAFAASFGHVAVGRQTTAHRHDEAEMFVILRGRGEVIVDDVPYRVQPGAVIFFEPFETHVLRNVGDDDLLFVDVYWRDPPRAADAAKKSGGERMAGRPIFVFSTPPTPNGDLHLGHLSGPYLAADVFVRFQRMKGVEAYHLTGSDDFQSYVVGRARQEKRSAAETAAHYAAEIRATLDLMDIPLDQYTITASDPGYADGLRKFFSRVVNSGAARPVRDEALFDSKTGAYLYEVDVGGRCPSCRAESGGNLCEECGEPNNCTDLLEPRSRLSMSPPRREIVERYSLPIHELRQVVLDHHVRAELSPRLRDLARRVLARETFHLPITHRSNWGIRPSEATEGAQVVWAWPEMAYGFLHGIAALGRRLGRDWAADRPEANWKIVHFFGFDNSFYHTILYPILYRLAYPQWESDISYFVNEFYLLDGQKFSTSRRHAIWGKEIVTEQTVDAVRYYLALTRGETDRTNFELHVFRRTVADILIGRWQAWLIDLGGRVETCFGGYAPDAGTWTLPQKAFLGRLETRLEAIVSYYRPESFSLNRVMRELNGLVDDACAFAAAYRLLAGVSAWQNEHRTAIALELAAAQLLAQVAAPVMPRFARRLGAALGDMPLNVWPDCVALVPPGAKIGLADTTFFVLPTLSAASDEAAPHLAVS